MRSPSRRALDALWSRHHGEWRDPAQIASQWQEATEVDPRLLRYTVRGRFWEELEKGRITLLVTREYEHLVIGLTVSGSRPVVTYMRLPHPSGLVYDRSREVVFVTSTRNPNQVYDLKPVARLRHRLDVELEPLSGHPLVPVRSRFYAGCSYFHDLALVGGALHANSVGQNAVVRLEEDGSARRVWWPRCIETKRGPLFGQNYIQLNSIAAGADLVSSFFSASADIISARRPGHRNFPVDGRGVIFAGKTREVTVRGLTRPHSARLRRGDLWVANSGYGELGVVQDGRFVPVTRLPGWTRGLCFEGRMAYVGTSRVIPRFRQYAPGLEVDGSRCGVHAVDTRTGTVVGSLIWPYGSQIFALDQAPRRVVSGFPFYTNQRGTAQGKKLFYAYATREDGHG